MVETDYSPVDGNVVVDVVDDLDEHGVALSRVQRWPRELPVHGGDGLGGAEPRKLLLRHLHTPKYYPWTTKLLHYYLLEKCTMLRCPRYSH